MLIRMTPATPTEFQGTAVHLPVLLATRLMNPEIQRRPLYRETSA